VGEKLDENWTNRWTPLASSSLRGGQGESLLAQDAAGQRVFIKKLKHNDRVAARRRFAREVRVYDTLEHPQLPRLIESNADEWRDRKRNLYLVLEAIDGPTLAEQVRSRGPLSPTDATAFVSVVLQTLEYCHNNDVVHRDIKPANVMLRTSDPRDAVIVDFGLSFNSDDRDLSDLTRVNEEIGNRFLRLPEHSTGGRSPVADITQAAGLLLFALTGDEPRVLIDDEGLKPHQRLHSRNALSATLTTGQFRRLQSVFDREFEARSAIRYPTAQSLRTGIMHAMSDEDPPPGLETLLSQLDDRIALEDHQAATEHATALKAFSSDLEAIATRFADSKQLQCSHGRGPDDFLAAVPYCHVNLALAPQQATAARSLVSFRVERLGTEVVVRVGNDVLWRGIGADENLSEIVIRRLIEHYLAARGPQP